MPAIQMFLFAAVAGNGQAATVGTVPLDSRAAESHGLPTSLRLPIGAVVVIPGLVLRVRGDGGLDPYPPLGWKSISADPAARASGRTR
jgi:hypothetical protein